jgi:polysaccharide biosynthesis/export protein
MRLNMRRLLEVATIPALLAGICIGQCASRAPAAHARVPQNNADVPAVPEFQERAPRYQLRPGDVFDVIFDFTPEFNQTVSVQPDGYVTLHGVGDLHIAGCTVPEVTKNIRDAYGRILKDPVVAVLLKDFDRPYFIAGGAVGHPGKYELRGDTTVVEAIEMAGGLSDSAKHSQVLLFRRVSQDWMQTTVLDVKKMLHDKSLKEDMHVRAGDMVFVPESRISKIRRYVPVPGMGIGLNPAIR